MPKADPPAAKLFVIRTHPCWTGKLLFEHKAISYREIRLPPGLHPIGLRLAGFRGTSDRTIDGARGGPGLTLGNRLGTVPALRMNGDRVMGNLNIARYLERIQPDPPLFPANPGRRAKVEEAEAWGDEVLQMFARRMTIANAMAGDAVESGFGDDGRMGPLLHRNARVRMAIGRMVGRTAFAVGEGTRAELLSHLPAILDRVDAWIEEGVLNSAELNAADYMIVTSLALFDYADDTRQVLQSRPAGALLDRILPA